MELYRLDFVTTYIQAFGFLPGKELDTRDISHQLNDSIPYLGRLFAVSLAFSLDQLLHVFDDSFWVSSFCEKAQFHVPHRPSTNVTYTLEVFGLFAPAKCNRAILKSPSLDNIDSLKKKRAHSPMPIGCLHHVIRVTGLKPQSRAT